MEDQRRFITFIIAASIVVVIFSTLMQRNRPPQPQMAPGGEQTTATVGERRGEAATTTTSSSATLGGPSGGEPRSAAEAEARRPRTARVVENTSITIQQHPGEITTVTTQKYVIGFDSIGGVVHSWRLTDPGSESMRKSMDTTQGIEMVQRIPSFTTEEFAPQTWPLEVSFSEASAVSYEDFNQVAWQVRRANDVVQMSSPSIRGLKIDKVVLLPADRYYSTLKIRVTNETSNTVPIYDDTGRGLTVRWGPGLVQRTAAEYLAGEGAYDAALFRDENGVQMFQPKPDKPALEAEGRAEWAGVESKFFAALLVPAQPDDAAKKASFKFRTMVPTQHNVQRKNYQPPLTMELSSERFDLPPGASKTFEFGVYVGPKKYRILNQYGHHLQSLMFHNSWSFMRLIYLFLTDVLNWIYRFVANYGFAIILLTILVRLATFPLTQHSIKIQAKTMAEQAKIKPYLDEINDKYKDDPQEKQKQIWKVYQEHGISPFGMLRGCVPMLLQLPIFVGLYRVCNDTIDLKGAHFMWMKDLSQPDHLVYFGSAFFVQHLNLLPILMGATQILATKVASAKVPTQDPTQKQMMYMMPIFMTVFLYSLPSGLMLYWIASNIWQIGQTMITNRKMQQDEQARLRSGQAVPFPPVAQKLDQPKKPKKK